MSCGNTHYSGCECYDKEFARTKAENSTLKAEIERLRQGYLADENGNEYVAVCILKEKIRDLESKLKKAVSVLEFIAGRQSFPDLDETEKAREGLRVLDA